MLSSRRRLVAAAAAAGVSIALVASAALPASADDEDAPRIIQNTLTLSSTSIVVGAFEEPSISVTTLDDGSDVTLWLLQDGVWQEQATEYLDDGAEGATSGTQSFDLFTDIDTLDTPLDAGRYSMQFRSEATSDTWGPDDEEVEFTAAESPVFTLDVTARPTSISGFSAADQTIAVGSKAGSTSVDVAWPEEDNTLALQRRAAGSDSWSSVDVAYASDDESTEQSLAFPKETTAGTYFYRVSVPATGKVTGAATVEKKVTVFTPKTVAAIVHVSAPTRMVRGSKVVLRARVGAKAAGSTVTVRRAGRAVGAAKVAKSGVARIVIPTSKLRSGVNRLSLKAGRTATVIPSKSVHVVVRVK